jgi:DNA-directed RNA polymerase sigma subunit (sigma70/sigma32)
MHNKHSRIATVDEIAGFLTHRADELNARERRILELHYGIGQGETYSTAEIGRLLKLSPSRVYEIQAGAVWRLRKNKKGLSTEVDNPMQARVY